MEKPSSSWSDIFCDLVNNVSTSLGEINGIDNDKDPLSNFQILPESLNNESASTSFEKTAVSDIENYDSNSCLTDTRASSFTTSPVVLHLRPRTHNNDENVINVSENKSCHEKRIYNEQRPFMCNICDKTFKRRSHYNVHLHTHNTERPYVCKTCNKSFTHHYFLKEHEGLHNTVKQFSCEYCKKEFSVRRYYNLHIRQHRKKKYECDACNFVSCKLKENNRHVETHGEMFICSKCNRYFCKKLSLNLHQCFPSDEKRFSCKMCAKTFRKVADLDTHMAAHENKRSIICNICLKGFNTKGALAAHVQSSHEEENEDKPYSCEVCEKKFHLQANLKRHKYVHKKKPQSVSIDPDSSISPIAQYQSRVNKMHSGVQVGYIKIESPVPMEKTVYFIPGKKIRHVCDICLKGFRDRKALAAHYRRHIGDKPFQCDVCSYRFADKNDLKRHLHIHTGIRKFSCDFCNKTFSRKSNLTTHLKICRFCKSIPKITSVFTVNDEAA